MVDWSAKSGGEFLDDCFKENPGNRRLGEFGIGTNMHIQADIPNLIFREKQAGTVHIAIGNGYKDGISDPEMANDGQTHLDLITDLKEESRLEIDGETVLENGKFTLDSLGDSASK